MLQDKNWSRGIKRIAVTITIIWTETFSVKFTIVLSKGIVNSVIWIVNWL